MKQAFKFVINFLSFGIPLLIQAVRKEKLVNRISPYVTISKQELRKETIKSLKLKFLMTIVYEESAPHDSGRKITSVEEEE